MRTNKGFFALTCGLFILVLISSAAALLIGPSGLTPAALLDALLDPENHRATYTILTSIRIPRVLAALIGGAGLAVSGAILQSVMDNPLAGPNTIGVNAGAGLAVVVCLAFFPGAVSALPFAAFFGAFITCILIMLLSRVPGRGRTTVILAGIAFTSLFQALISFITALDSDILAIYASFSLGSFSGVLPEQLILPGVIVLVCFALSLLLSGRITALTLGDTLASSLGIRVKTLRLVCLMLASLSAAAVISYAGLLGFVGLVVPNMARKMVCGSFFKQLTVSVLLGSLLLIWTDLLGRTLFSPSEISVGIFTALIGAPIFFAILLRRRTAHDA